MARNLVLVWDPLGKVIDAGVNLIGNFHCSKSTLCCHAYYHMMALSDGHVLECDSSFAKSGKLKSWN